MNENFEIDSQAETSDVPVTLSRTEDSLAAALSGRSGNIWISPISAIPPRGIDLGPMTVSECTEVAHAPGFWAYELGSADLSYEHIAMMLAKADQAETFAMVCLQPDTMLEGVLSLIPSRTMVKPDSYYFTRNDVQRVVEKSVANSTHVAVVTDLLQHMLAPLGLVAKYRGAIRIVERDHKYADRFTLVEAYVAEGLRTIFTEHQLRLTLADVSGSFTPRILFEQMRRKFVVLGQALQSAEILKREAQEVFSLVKQTMMQRRPNAEVDHPLPREVVDSAAMQTLLSNLTVVMAALQSPEDYLVRSAEFTYASLVAKMRKAIDSAPWLKVKTLRESTAAFCHKRVYGPQRNLFACIVGRDSVVSYSPQVGVFFPHSPAAAGDSTDFVFTLRPEHQRVLGNLLANFIPAEHQMKLFHQVAGSVTSLPFSDRELDVEPIVMSLGVTELELVHYATALQPQIRLYAVQDDAGIDVEHQISWTMNVPSVNVSLPANAAELMGTVETTDPLTVVMLSEDRMPIQAEKLTNYSIPPKLLTDRVILNHPSTIADPFATQVATALYVNRTKIDFEVNLGTIAGLTELRKFKTMVVRDPALLSLVHNSVASYAILVEVIESLAEDEEDGDQFALSIRAAFKRKVAMDIFHWLNRIGGSDAGRRIAASMVRHVRNLDIVRSNPELKTGLMYELNQSLLDYQLRATSALVVLASASILTQEQINFIQKLFAETGLYTSLIGSSI